MQFAARNLANNIEEICCWRHVESGHSAGIPIAETMSLYAVMVPWLPLQPYNTESFQDLLRGRYVSALWHLLTLLD